jgi:hypothetical protein
MKIWFFLGPIIVVCAVLFMGKPLPPHEEQENDAPDS